MMRRFLAACLTAGMLFFLAGPSPAAERAFRFALPDLQGRTVSLTNASGKTSLLIFGTTWCPTCRSEIPTFKRIFNTYGPRGLAVYYIDIQESRSKVSRFAARHALPYPVLLDATGEIAIGYKVSGVPAMILIQDGRIVTRNYRLVEPMLQGLLPRR